METNLAEAIGFRRDRITWLAYLALGFYAYLEIIPGPVMPFLQTDLHLNYGVASLHFGALSLGSMCIGLIGAGIIQRMGRQRAFWGGAIGMAAGAGMLAWSPSAIGTITGAGLLGFAGTMLLIAIQSILSDRHGERRTIAFAESNVVAGLCAILATVAVGGLAATMLGWRSSLGLALIAIAVLLLTFHSEWLGNETGNPSEQHRSLRLPRRFWVLWTVTLLGSSVEWCIVFWGATFLGQAVGFEKALAAATMSVFFAAIVIGRFIASRLAVRMESGTLLLLSQGITLIGFPLFWLATNSQLNVAGLFVAGVGIGNFYPMTLATAIGAAPHLPELASARLTVAVGLAGLIAPVALGWLADQMTIQQAYVIVLPLLLIAGVLAALEKGGRFGK